LLQQTPRGLRAAGKIYPRALCETRPPISETASVTLALEIAMTAGANLHIYHASLPRLYPRKGILSPGADADIVIIDPHASWTITPETLHSNAAGRRTRGGRSAGG
jgi:dihydroorotase-like cyclic amidohydrolase